MIKKLFVSVVTIVGSVILLAPQAYADSWLCNSQNSSLFSVCINAGFTAHGYESHYLDDVYGPSGSGVGYWKAYNGHNCTNYVGYMLTQNGNSGPGVAMGNGGSWDDTISQHDGGPGEDNWGYTVNTTPAVGSIALWDGSPGHVAYVESVGINTITVSEDNAPIWNSFRWRTIDTINGDKPHKYLHIADIPLDSDNDGVNDDVDGCPNDPGPTWNNGCPVVDTASTSGATYRQKASDNGATQVFVQGPNNTLMSYHTTYGTPWSSGNQIGATGSTFSKASAVHNQTSGATLVFAQGPNNSLIEYWNAPGSSNWYSATIAGAGTTYSAPSAVYNQANGVTLVFAQGPNNSLVEHWNTYGQPTWSSASIAGAGTTYSAPSAVNDQTGTLDGFTQVFAQGANNSLATYWNTYGQPTWSSANVAGSNTTYSAPAAVYNQSNSFTQVFAQGASNTLQAYYTTPGSAWSAGNPIGGSGTTYSAPTAAYNQDNSQGGITLVFARGANNSLANYHNLYGHPWGGGTVAGTVNTVYSDPATVYNQTKFNGFTQVFTMGPNNSLNNNWNTYGQTTWYSGSVAGSNTTYSGV